MREAKENIIKEEVVFKENVRTVINNEVREFKEKSRHEFDKKIADKLVFQNVAEYVSTSKKKTEENNLEDTKEIKEKNIIKK